MSPHAPAVLLTLVPVTFNLDPLKLVPPEQILLKYLDPPWKICFHYRPATQKKNQWLLRTLVEFTVAYLDCFSWVCRSGPTQRSKRAFVANFAQWRGNWLLCTAGNETTVHCVLLNWQAWVVSRNFGSLRGMPLVQVFASEMCSGSTFFHLWEVVQIFQ